MAIKGAQIAVECLKREGVDTIFCYQGGSVIPLFDALYEYGKGIRLIQPRHEQGGTHAADGYARSTGKVGVVIVTSGPGSTNTITGIATAYLDSVPLVVIAGQVPISNIGTDAFQELDMGTISLSITKASFLIRKVEDIGLTFRKAFHIARSGRPGPVVIELPVNLQKEETELNFIEETFEEFSWKREEEDIDEKIEELVLLLRKAKRPVVISGGGVIFSDAAEEMNKFIDKFGIPCVTTLMGHGLNPTREELLLGGVGMHGSVYSNKAVQNSDLILAFGTRFSDRVLGNPKAFAPEAKIVHIDIDESEIGKNVDVYLSIVAPVKKVLKALCKIDENFDFSDWVEEILLWKKKYPLSYSEGERLKPQRVIQTLSEIFPEDTIVAVDVGQNQMWVAQYYKFRKPRCLLSSSGLGTMGYALPAAIGAKIGNPDREVLMIAGDGGFQMNIQELATVKRYGLNLKMVVLDNGYLGMVRQWQELFFQRRYVQTDMSDNPDFAAIARAFGIKSRKLFRKEELKDAMEELLRSEESFLLHVVVEREENVFPMVPPGKPISNVLIKPLKEEKNG